MIGKPMGIMLLLCLMALPAMSWAAAEVKVSVSAEQEISVTENGETRSERIPASNAKPGDELIYTVNYRNAGDETATNVIIEDPIPANSIYVGGSNIAPGVETSFSIDGGKSFSDPGSLTYEVRTADGVHESMAEPSKYTHIRWILDELSAGESGHTSFRVRVK